MLYYFIGNTIFHFQLLAILLFKFVIKYFWPKKKVCHQVLSSLLSSGSWVPSAFVLWFMRELPPPITNRQREQSTTIAFISHAGVGPQHPHQWATVTSSNNQVLFLFYSIVLKFNLVFFSLLQSLETFSLNYGILSFKKGRHSDINLTFLYNAGVATKSRIRKTHVALNVILSLKKRFWECWCRNANDSRLMHCRRSSNEHGGSPVVLYYHFYCRYVDPTDFCLWFMYRVVSQDC